LQSLTFHSEHINGLAGIAQSSRLRELYLLPYLKLEESILTIIDSLTGVQDLTGLNPADQSEPSFLDRILIGKPLRSLSFTFTGKQIPLALI